MIPLNGNEDQSGNMYIGSVFAIAEFSAFPLIWAAFGSKIVF